MSEFHTDSNGEYLVIPDDELAAAMKLSESTLEDSFDDAEHWIGDTGMATHVRITHEGGVVLLASQDTNSRDERIRYILDTETGGFIVIRGTLADAGVESMPALDPEFIHESIESMAALGQYLGTEQDWQAFMDILRDGKTAKDNLRAFHEQCGRTALRRYDDWDISELTEQ